MVSLKNSVFRIRIATVFSFFCVAYCSSQELHHQMLSAQGATTELKSGHYVSQTIGQQSSIGNSATEKLSVIQGFQQSAWAKLIANTTLPNLQSVTAYPNPFTSAIYFEFGSGIEGEVAIQLFNVSGQLVLTKDIMVSNNILQLQLGHLPQGLYLAQLRTNTSTYYTKIIKN